MSATRAGLGQGKNPVLREVEPPIRCEEPKALHEWAARAMVVPPGELICPQRKALAGNPLTPKA